ncbi:serine/threonine-protein kinase [Microbacterium sulfonylureivorans]|uniref:serine/threonine-protein kinase n=1 Tax=Microbacterium sulfonylureivorans TaxID=2486854 RepID=UPI000FDC1705|nr:serine/threonine-protein kinase [Microbacterium sulfonylureivorans]
MTDLREAGEVSTGEILDGRYRLMERIGEGGMARVYRAEDAALQRTVAIKVLRGPIDEVGSIERALSETTLLASLNHHSLVTLFDAHVSADDSSYLVMEYVEGETLRDLIGRGPVDPALMASITVDIAEGLHIAHSAGVVHRDIKPSNVLLWRSLLPGHQWRAKLADFGIAYLLDSPRMTTPGMAVGTVAYIAPEQARGETPAPPADVYALGIMLIEALTGTRPFAEAEGIGTVMARLAAPPPIPDTLHPAWQGLLRGMTTIRPDDRPTALEVAVTAARLAKGDSAGVATSEPTATAPVAVTSPAVVETRPTAVLPAPVSADVKTVALAATEAADAVAAAPPLPPPPLPTRRAQARPAQSRRRRRLVIGAVIGAIALAAVIAVTAWSLSLAGTPTPAPISPSVVEPSVEPSVAPSIAPTEEEPAPAEDDGAGDNSGSGSTGGNGNSNSGPGNNNGNGKGKGKGNDR